jgi:N-acetylmuramoyl-L-alanine amidase
MRLTAIILALILMSAAQAARITGAEVDPHKKYDKIYIHTTGDLRPKPLELEDRLVFDFKNAEARAKNITVKKSSRISSVRFGQFTADTARVVIDLKRPVSFDYAVIYGKNQVEIELLDKGEAKPFAVKNKPLPSPVPSPKPIVVEEKPKITEEAIAKKPVVIHPTKTLAKKVSLKGKVIVVDPGHGGSDPGAQGPDGMWEKEANLKVALYLANYLEARGARVHITRTSDVKVKLPEIAALTNRVRASAYVGVHFNSIEDPKVSGTETFYYTPQSLRLAEAVHDSLVRRIRRQDRGIKREMFYTINHTESPAIIVEPIYLTNFQDGRLIRSPSFQKEVARDIALGMIEYFYGQ